MKIKLLDIYSVTLFENELLANPDAVWALHQETESPLRHRPLDHREALDRLRAHARYVVRNDAKYSGLTPDDYLFVKAWKATAPGAKACRGLSKRLVNEILGDEWRTEPELRKTLAGDFRKDRYVSVREVTVEGNVIDMLAFRKDGTELYLVGCEVKVRYQEIQRGIGQMSEFCHHVDSAWMVVSPNGFLTYCIRRDFVDPSALPRAMAKLGCGLMVVRRSVDGPIRISRLVQPRHQAQKGRRRLLVEKILSGKFDKKIVT